ncbi:hypothetical protein RDABS01_020801 [Bienertia sinuspersici]
MEKKTHSDGDSDRISNLPEPIRRHILSFLPTRDAVRASILSSSWRELWVELPTLDFGRFQLSRSLTVENLPCNDQGDGARMRRESIIKKREQFYNFLDHAFGLILKLEMLSLYLPHYDLELKSRVDGWLDCVVSHVKELKLEIGKSETPRYSLPKSVLGANSITKLELQGCELNSASLVNTQLPSLRKLSLQNVYLDEEVMESLPASFPNLEAFNFNCCHGLTRLEVSGLTKLVKVDVEHISHDNFEEIVIDEPSLLEFTYVYEGDFDEFFQSCDIVISGCKNLKYLKLVGAKFDDMDLNMLLGNLPVLEQLFLYQCDNLRDVGISSEHLVQLEFEHCRDLLTAALYTPNLKVFHYAEDDPITITGKGKGSVFKLKKGSVYLKPDIKIGKWYVNLIKFLSKLGHCEQLSICVGLEEDLIVPENVRMKSRPPLHGVKHLMVELRASFRKHTLLQFVEALLWLAPSPESISIYNDFIPICKVLKFTYEKQPKGMKKCGCWKSPAIICWRHALDKVSLENQEGDEDDTRLATLFSNARFDGKRVCFVKSTGPRTQ